MTTAIERVPENWRSLLIDVLGRQEPEVLAILQKEQELTDDQARRGMRALQWEFGNHLGADDEPTALGKEVDDLVDVFIKCFIMDRDG